MRIISLVSRLIFVFGGILLMVGGFAFGGGLLSLLLPAFGVYFTVRGACFLSSAVA